MNIRFHFWFNGRDNLQHLKLIAKVELLNGKVGSVQDKNGMHARVKGSEAISTNKPWLVCRDVKEIGAYHVPSLVGEDIDTRDMNFRTK